jgi:hypothetical protein
MGLALFVTIRWQSIQVTVDNLWNFQAGAGLGSFDEYETLALEHVGAFR